MSEVTRREALKLILATGAAASTATSTACDARPVAPESVPQAEGKLSRAVLALAPLTFPWQTHDPFLFCVHHDDHYPMGNAQLGPATSLAGRNLGQDFDAKDGFRMYHGEVVPGFPQHPHRGFETVTVVRRGMLDHADSLGAAARYGGGDVQWLTAGKGIQHAEMFPLLNPAAPNPVELFQIWLNLPRVNKMVEPHFSMFWQLSIPQHTSLDEAGHKTQVSLIAGGYEQLNPPPPPPDSWANAADSDVAIWTIKLDPFARWTLPSVRPETLRSLYFFRGAGLRIEQQIIPSQHHVELNAGKVTLQAGADQAELLLLQGRPIGEPVARRGPFVMNTQAEIEQAFADYRQTQFGGWPWPRRDPVHPREEARFARHANGRLERPA